jgi:LysR family nitrogen assimilation transcriptional regulator
MQLRQLRYFIAVARRGSFSKASAELHIAQPALSSQIAGLEEELGVRLLVRHSRGVELTAAGAHLLSRSDEVFNLIESIENELAPFRGGIHGEVRLGLPTTTTSVLALPLLETARERFPGLALHVVEGMTGHLEGWLAHDDIDIAVLFGSGSAPRFLHRHLGSESLFLVGPKAGRLEERSSLAFAEIGDLPLVHTTPLHRLRRMIDEQAVKLKVPLNLIAEIDSLAQIKALVYHGHGYTILPRAAVSPDWVSGPIGFWRILDPDFRIQLVAVASPRSERQPYCEPAFDLLKDVVGKLIGSGRWAGASLDAVGPVDARPDAGPGGAVDGV